MHHASTAAQLLDREMLGIRSRLIDLAATLDRIDRAGGSVADDPRLAKIRETLALLSTGSADRAGQVQMIFSLPYNAQWRKAEA